jgi:hypothetical protein
LTEIMVLMIASIESAADPAAADIHEPAPAVTATTAGASALVKVGIVGLCCGSGFVRL